MHYPFTYIIALSLQLTCCAISAQTVSFETIPGGSPSDGLAINTQFQANFGISFSLEGGGSPVLAQVGSPQTAFQGFGLLPDEPAPGTNAGMFFLTDDGSVTGPPAPLIVTYSTPVAAASGVLLDIDGNEAWQIQARDSSAVVIDTVNLNPNNELDGSATSWSFNRVNSDIFSIRLVYSGTQTAFVGLAFDNFSPSTAISDLPILGDVNLDGVVDFFDISPFIAILSSQGFQTEADIDLDLDVDFFDISPFIAILSGQQSGT